MPEPLWSDTPVDIDALCQAAHEIKHQVGLLQNANSRIRYTSHKVDDLQWYAGRSHDNLDQYLNFAVYLLEVVSESIDRAAYIMDQYPTQEKKFWSCTGREDR